MGENLCDSLFLYTLNQIVNNSSGLSREAKNAGLHSDGHGQSTSSSSDQRAAANFADPLSSSVNKSACWAGCCCALGWRYRCYRGKCVCFTRQSPLLAHSLLIPHNARNACNVLVVVDGKRDFDSLIAYNAVRNNDGVFASVNYDWNLSPRLGIVGN